MEGLYFESSATVPFHFMTVSELAKDPSNPVRGLVYGSSTSPTDFALGVKHMQMLGVSYLMLFSPQSKEMAADQPGLKLVATVPDLDGQPPNGWNIYKVEYPGGESPLVTGLSAEPIVASVHGGNYEQCWGKQWTDTTPMPELSPWECAAAPWFMNAAQLDKVWIASGPKSWKHVDIKDLATTNQTAIVPTKVSDIHQDPSTISFHVSEIGKPVLVRTSYFPNWEVQGADRAVPGRAEHDGGRPDEPRREAHLRTHRRRLARALPDAARPRGPGRAGRVEGRCSATARRPTGVTGRLAAPGRMATIRVQRPERMPPIPGPEPGPRAIPANPGIRPRSSADPPLR